MHRCAFLTTDNLEDFFIYDDLVKPHLQELGWQVDDVCWRNQHVNYNDYDLIIVRSTWDYQAHPQAFLTTLKQIEASSAQLHNSFSLMQWNFSKDYLKDLAQKGVPILPTIWLDEFDASEVQKAFSHFQAAQIIIKPLVSANADFTYRLSEEDLLFQQQGIKDALLGRKIMVQKFEKSIIEQGECSLFYFSGDYSHAINKMPAKGDFRVQEEHGGQLVSVTPTNTMFELAEKTLQALPEIPLYARIDILDTALGLAIIEVELIEPSLYFNMDEDSALRFAKAVNRV